VPIVFIDDKILKDRIKQYRRRLL